MSGNRGIFPSKFVLGALAIACSSGAPTPRTPGPERAPAAVASPPSSAAPATPGALAPAPERATYADPPGPGVLAALPRGAAFYTAAHVDLLDEIEVLGELERALLGKGRSLRELFRTMGGDSQRALLAAVVPPSEANARAVLKAFIKAGPGKAFDAAFKRHEAEAISIRVIVPLSPGVDPAQAARALVEEVSGRRSELCAEVPKCAAAFQVEKPLVIGVHANRVMAVYPMPNGVRIDLAQPLFGAGIEKLDALVRLGSLSGGPEPPRCQVFDASAGAALCVDADRAGELGAAIGYAKTLSAVDAAGLKTLDARRIAEFGLNEARQNMLLAAPSRRLLDDGTLKADITEHGFKFTASFARTLDSKDSLERAFAAADPRQHCAVGEDVLMRLFPQMVGAFGDAGPDFADSARTLRSIQEAGWGAWLVMFGRTWPNVLVSARERLLLVNFPRVPLGRTCVRLNDERLEIHTTPDTR